MSLAEEIAAASTRQHPCRVRAILQALDDADRATLDAALVDPTIRHSAIADGLTNIGVRVTEQVIGRHRSRKCSCRT